jgi:hypothetical protein
MKTRKLERTSINLLIKLLAALAKNSDNARARVQLIRNFKKDIQQAETIAVERIVTGTLLLEYWLENKKNG